MIIWNGKELKRMQEEHRFVQLMMAAAKNMLDRRDYNSLFFNPVSRQNVPLIDPKLLPQQVPFKVHHHAVDAVRYSLNPNFIMSSLDGLTS